MKILPPLLASACLAVLPAFAQNLPLSVYSLPGEDGAVFNYLPISEGVEYGDAAGLGGTSRFITDASVAVYSDVARTGSVTLSFYEPVPADFSFPDGFEVGQPGVTPGALADFKPAVDPIWTSGPREVAFEGAGPSLLNLTELIFTDINTLVPDDLFWSIKFDLLTDFQNGDDFGIKLENAAALGPAGASTDGSRFYQRASDRFLGDWFPTWLDQAPQPTSTLSLQLNAIPEPGVALLTTIGVFGLLRRRRA